MLPASPHHSASPEATLAPGLPLSCPPPVIPPPGHLASGKVQFSYIYIVFIVGLFSLWAVLNLMSLRGLDIYRTASVLGYCLLPIVLLAAISIPLDLTGAWGAAFVPLAIFWCSNAAALFFVVILQADDQRWLLVYPVMLFYTCFALITIF